ncbi:hypothetical protein [Streptomyces sp. NPDC004266]|uniref:hypothetical protein n=1 Tax=Streptomyces sp. NPDC004266 TaxID=3364693 RepID=UPI0036A4F754
MIFHDPDAPDEEKTLDPQQIAEIESAHQEALKDRVEALLWQRLPAFIPEVSPAKTAVEVATERGLLSERNLQSKTLMFAMLPEAKQQEILAKEQETRDAVIKKYGIEDCAAVTEEDVKAAKERAREQLASTPGGQGLLRLAQTVQESDEAALKEYLMATTRPEEKSQRDLAWEMFAIVTAGADLPDTRYRPCRTQEGTVRFKDGGYIGINESPGGRGSGPVIDDPDNEFQMKGVSFNGQRPALWVKVVDGWAKDGNWGGHLQVTCATANGYWIAAHKGSMKAATNKTEPITFYDMGPYYEIWHQDRTTGAPLVVRGDRLHFEPGATPDRFNLQDATWG